MKKFEEIGKQGFTYTQACFKPADAFQRKALKAFWEEFKNDLASNKGRMTITRFQSHMHRLMILCDYRKPKNAGIGEVFFSPSLLDDHKWLVLSNYEKVYDEHLGLRPSGLGSYKAILFSKKGEFSYQTILESILSLPTPLWAVAFAINPSDKAHDGIYNLPNTFFSHDHFHYEGLTNFFKSFPFIHTYFKDLYKKIEVDTTLSIPERHLLQVCIFMVLFQTIPEYWSYDIRVGGNLSSSTEDIWKELTSQITRNFYGFTAEACKENLSYKDRMAAELEKKIITELKEKGKLRGFSHPEELSGDVLTEEILFNYNTITKKEIESQAPKYTRTFFINERSQSNLLAEIGFKLSSLSTQEDKEYKYLLSIDRIPSLLKEKTNEYEFLNTFKVKAVVPLRNPEDTLFNDKVIKELTNSQFQLKPPYKLTLKDFHSIYCDAYKEQIGFRKGIDHYPDAEEIKEYLENLFNDAGNLIKKYV